MRMQFVAVWLACSISICFNGCTEPPGTAGSQPVAANQPALPPPPSHQENTANTPAPNSPIIGRTTQEIREAKTERAKGAREADKKISGGNPIIISGNAYVTIIGQASIFQIKHAVDIYHALNDRYPRDLDEFMTEIVKKNNIRLPALPYYQTFAYDSEKHELVILEYPDKKH